MKKSALFFLLFISSAYGQSIFQKTYGGSANDWARAIQQTSDGGFIIVGSTMSFGAGGLDVYVLKTDVDGNVLWTRTFGGAGNDFGDDVQLTSDNGFIIGGSTFSFGSGLSDAYLIRLDQYGDTLWTRTYGGSNYDLLFRLKQTDDGGFIAAGQYINTGDSVARGCVFKTNAMGDLEWSKIFGIPIYSCNAMCVQQTVDGGYVVGGVNPLGHILILRLDNAGDTLWTKTYGSTYYQVIKDLFMTSDGGFLFAASYQAAINDYDVYLFRTNSNGDTLWTRSYGGSEKDEASTIRQTSDGGFIISGNTYSFGAGVQNAFLIRTDSIGQMLWSKAYGDTGLYQAAVSGISTLDGGFVFAGDVSSMGVGDVYLIKTDSVGNSGCFEMSPPAVTSIPPITPYFQTVLLTSGLNSTYTQTQIDTGGTTTIKCYVGLGNEPELEKSIQIYPNPCNQYFSIRCEGRGKIRLLDIHGQELISTDAKPGEIKLETDKLPSGLFIIHFALDSGNHYSKILVVHQ